MSVCSGLPLNYLLNLDVIPNFVTIIISTIVYCLLHCTTSTFVFETIETKTSSCIFKSLNEFELAHLGSENINVELNFQLFLTEKWATRTDKYVTLPNQRL